ncbi:sirohydrochlorin chelatase [Antrihabitans cavernicola]|uniref:Sirohydrochlorin chelatase n=1 Tax=Antrihabitans cavernicola TaxID=2495913 RepID=A0A5A7SAN4_9NOCA|nr:sirohydrochlorin chelatase [Spelaeibacter cavernicola]KAA0022976.1 sirohydrochlorin chelatase [Spelaeibacter cavernicola]
MVPLIAVAHGSRDPRSARVMAAVVDEVRRTRPGLDVRLCFLDLNAPSVHGLIDAIAAEGHTGAVVAPLLLGNAFHARIDLPGILARARADHPHLALQQADVLGADPRLPTIVRNRVIDAGAISGDARLGVAVAAVGSSRVAANLRTRRVVDAVVAGTEWRAELCFATADPSVEHAIAALRARGARRIVVAPWFLAPGLLTDRVAAAANSADADVTCADVLGSHHLVASVLLDRYDLARSQLDGRPSDLTA